jgi:hypothetical protein
MKNEKKNPIIANDIYNRFERSHGTFSGGGGKKHSLSSMTLDQFA